MSESLTSPSLAWTLYLGAALGAIALYMIVPRKGYNPTRLGAILGGLTLGGVWLALFPRLGDLGVNTSPVVYYYIFSALAIGSAVRVITHPRPVFSALWFVMVILASAGLLLVLTALFVAFALVIIYAGAILVTYVFVIMLAAQAADPEQPETAPEFERSAREPMAAVVAGFLLLAVMLTAGFSPIEPNPDAAWDEAGVTGQLTERPQVAMLAEMGLSAEDADLVGGSGIGAELDNIERVGMDLFQGHPLGLELAGVILLLALIGAVVMARQKVDEAEDKTEQTKE